jgi:hypothetical protein
VNRHLSPRRTHSKIEPAFTRLCRDKVARKGIRDAPCCGRVSRPSHSDRPGTGLQLSANPTPHQDATASVDFLWILSFFQKKVSLPEQFLPRRRSRCRQTTRPRPLRPHNAPQQTHPAFILIPLFPILLTHLLRRFRRQRRWRWRGRFW